MHWSGCVFLNTILPLCHDPDVYMITPLCYWFRIEHCQDAAATEKTDTACSAGANNI